ncbi:CvpA family protein [Hyphomicrobium sp. D-2]|uniref:CvpA family protein n=1 Tax=Hyphomicrobium sp. D-2 TaxID=3041621 RepID=UPI002456930A|nr:CvpA family protein [Hyphomicrobium sp. D-2]MDH4981600.1 CvpA family protein [Hyphomicrobium sp. D-2]
MLGPITYLDAAVLAICFISGLLAMYRGFSREMLSIISWAVAAAAVLYFVLFHKPFAQDMAAQMGTPVAVAQIVVGAVIFLIVLIVVHLLTARLSDTILDSRVGMVDRVLGFLFGVARGFILIVIPYMFYEAFFPDREQHFPWVKEAVTLPYIQSTGNSIRYVLEAYMPSSLTNPGGDQPQDEQPTQLQQQGSLQIRQSDEMALEAGGRYHISVTWTVRAS